MFKKAGGYCNSHPQYALESSVTLKRKKTRDVTFIATPWYLG